MAMEKQFMIRDTHSKAVTAIGFHPLRREIVIGFEDGVMKWWEQDNGKLMLTTHEHKGWLTDFLYWSEPKILLSSANDGYIVAWASNGIASDKIQIGFPIFCMCFNPRRHHFICTFNSQLRIYTLDVKRTYGHLIDTRKPFIAQHHNDIIPCVICHDSRVYTAGYDAKLCIYDTTLYPGSKGLDLIRKVSDAHEAGITCMALVKDNENNTWILTGSFDRSVKVWSQDGKLRHQLETIFLSTITSLCYCARAKTVWIASGVHFATMYDPKAGENISEFLPTFQQGIGSGEDFQHRILKLRYNADSSQVIGTTHRRHVIVWKYNPTGCITALKCKHPIDSICYTRKVPMLLFSGDSDGTINKWERLQSSHFMYSMESLARKEACAKVDSIKKLRGLSKKRSQPLQLVGEPARPNTAPVSPYAFKKATPIPLYQGKNVSLLCGTYVEHLDLLVTSSEDGNIYVWGFDHAAVSALTKLAPKKDDYLKQKYSILFDEVRRNPVPLKQEDKLYGEHAKTIFATENNGVHDVRGVPVPEAGEQIDADGRKPESETQGESFADSVTNRVAGFICKDVLMAHDASVTAVAVVDKEDECGTTYMLSGGWDRRILLWNLRTGQLHDQLRSSEKVRDESKAREIAGGDSVRSTQDVRDILLHGELACDGVILSMEYCQERDEFAYSSSDGMVFIRAFSDVGSEMKLRNTLQGHDREVTCVRWNNICKKWITGSEDETIRIWSGDGMTCEHIWSTNGSVSAMCIDQFNGCVVAGVDNMLNVYDLETANLVQTNVGHTDSIRNILHVKERSQYVSVSWDKSIRIWNSYRRPIRRRKPAGSEQNDIVVPQVQPEKKVVIE